jgi:Cd2+/Zn2+-exporting ATPase
MLTGDNRITANAIARAVGIDQVYAELSPEDKVEKVDQLVERYGVVAMVGDGVNDAPALARASLGIAMGAIGSDAAIETADIALMTDDISKLPWLVRHAKWTLAVIRQNIVFSLVVKAAFVVLTFAGLATLWGAIAADAGASLAVVMNALRLLRPFDEQRDSAPAERPAPRSSKRKVVVWMSGATGALLLGLALIAGWRTFSIPEPQGLEQAPPTASKEVDQTPPTEPAPRQKSDESAPASRSPSSTREHKKPVLPDVSALEVPSSDPKAKLIALLEKDPSPGASRSVDLDEVIFEEGKSKPSLSGRRQLEAIAKILRSYPDRRIIVGGHTDRQGNPRANKRLSEKRAQFVLRELVEMGVSASRLQARGYGGDRPVARDDTREGETKNRRISLEVIEHR